MQRNKSMLKRRAQFGSNARKARLALYPRRQKGRARLCYYAGTRRLPSKFALCIVVGVGLSRSSSAKLAEQNL
jgi:hypothetical protein